MAAAPMGTALRQMQRLFVEGRLGEPCRRRAPRTVSLRGRRGGVHGPGRAARPDGPGHVPGRAPRRQRCGGCVPGHVPGPGLQGAVDPRPWRACQLALSGRPSHRHPGRGRGRSPAKARTTRRSNSDATDGDRVEPDDEWREILHEEVARLSDKYRLPLLLCDLEGKTHAQAATELELRRGDRPAAAGRRPRPPAIPADPSRRGPHGRTLATALGRSALANSPPGMGRGDRQGRRRDELDGRADRRRRDRLDDRREPRAPVVARHAMGSIAGGGGFGRLPDRARRDGLGCRDIRAGQGRGSSDSADAESPIRAGRSPGTSEDREASRSWRRPSRIEGRVLDADGRPFPGAALYLNPHEFQDPYHSPVRATSGPDGRFRFAVPKSDFDTLYWDAPWKGMRAPVLARAAGYAFGLANYRDDAERVDLAARS